MPDFLTDVTIKALVAPAGGRVEVADADVPGLRLRVTSSGSRTWLLWYRTKSGEARRYRLGVYPDLTLAAARKAARHHRTDIDRGQDPQGARQAARRAARARRSASTLSDLCDAFVRDQRKRWRPSTAAGWCRYIDADIKPALGKRFPSEITTDDVIAFIERLQATRGPVSVSRAYEVLRRLFRWAVAHRKIPASPCAGLDAGELLTRAARRDRVYTDDEIRALLGAAGQTELRDLLPLLFLTAARGGEARAAEARDVDLGAKVWTVPAANSKTGEAHRIPLSSAAVAILERLPRDGFVLPAPTREGFMDKPRFAVLKLRRLSGVKDFRLHDVRRTVRQRLADMGVAAYVAESVLGHLPPKIVRTYTPQWEPLPEMRRALEAWAAELNRIVLGDDAEQRKVLSWAR